MKTTNLNAVLISSLFLAGFCGLSAKAQISVVSADPLGNPNAVYVVYSANADPTSATATGHYTLSNTLTTALVTISSAILAPDNVTVQLNLGSSLQVTNNYTLIINNVSNAALSAVISPNPTLVNFWYGGNPNGATFTFDNGIVPAGTWLSTNATDTAGNGLDPYLMVTNKGGIGNSGMLILTAVTGSTHWLAPTNTRADVAAGQAFGQWHISDLANGQPITNLVVAFDLFYGNGFGGTTTNLMTDAAHTGANGMVFHWGPGLDPNGVDQYSGGASSWGQGLDVGFRLYSSSPNFPGINIFYGQNAGPGANNPIATNAFLDYFTGNLTNTWPGYTNDPTQIGFSSNYTHIIITINVTNSPTVTNAIVSVTCSNAWVGVTNIEWYLLANDFGSSFVIPNFNMSRVAQPMAFTSTDGAGGHSDGFLDNADFTVNGVHIPGGATPVGPIGVSVQPASQVVPENVYVTFNVGVTGAPPYFYQWYSNSVAIPGATGLNYTTPLTLYSNASGGLAMGSNVVYSVAVSNNFSSAVSSNANLTIIRDTNGVQVLSVGSVDGNSIGVLFSGYVDTATAGNAANYRINGGAVSVISATVRTNIANFGDPVYNYIPSYLTTVTLTNGTPVSGSYTVTVSFGSSVLSRTAIQVAQTNLAGTVAGLTDVDLGNPGTDPFALGQAFSGASNLMEIVASGSDIMAIAPSGTSDQGNYAYLLRTGNFDMVANLTWETPTANGAKAGMMVRPSPNGSSDASSPAISEIVFPAAPNRNTYETAMRTSESSACVSWAASGAPTSGHAAAYWSGSPSGGNNWIRIRRVGPYFNGYASPNGSIWTLIGSVTADTNTFPPAEFVGLVASAGNNDGRYNEADFKGFGPLAFSGATVTLPINLQANYVVPQNAPYPLAIGAQVSGGIALQSDIVYQWQRAESNNPTVFNDIADGTGNTNLYITPVLTIAHDNGAKYRCIAFVGDITTGHSVTSVVANLTVIIDTNPPSMTGASGDGTFTQVWINFDKGMNQGSLQNTANYKLIFGSTNISICGAVATANSLGLYTKVVLTLCSPLTSSIGYTLSLTNLLDLAGNNINSNVASNRIRTVTGWALVKGYLKYERWDGPLYPSGVGTYQSSITNQIVYNPRWHYDAGAYTPATIFNPTSPDQVELITYSGYPNGDIANVTVDLFDFGARISGYVIPPINADYTFFVRGNDGTALFVSPDSTRANEIYVGDADVGYASPGPTWAYGLGHIGNLSYIIGALNAAPITMTNGGLYYVEALEQQGNGSGWLEFTWGSPNPVGFDGGVLTNTDYTAQTDVNTRTNLAGGAYAPGRVAGATTAPGNGGAPTNAWNIIGTNIAIYVDPDISGITATGLTNTTVLAGNAVTLSVNASAVLDLGTVSASQPVTLPANNVFYQWYSNNVALAGATNASYTTPVFAFYTPPNTNFTYSVAISVANGVQTISFMAITNSAIVTELPNPPSVASASSFGGNTIGIQYNKAMDPNTSTNAAHYSIIGCATTVTGVRMMPDGKTVLLALSANLCDGAFTVAITNVQDTAGNTIAANTTTSGNVIFTQLTAADIGVATSTSGSEPLVVLTNSALTNVTFDLNYPGTAVMVTDGVFQVQASGQGSFTNQDGLHYIYEQKSGDFDVKVRVERLDTSDAKAKAGLMARADLTPGSDNFMIAVGPSTNTAADGTGAGNNGVTLLRRQTPNAVITGFPFSPNPPVQGAGPAMYPIWVRMQRTGPALYTYTSGDGTNWHLCGFSTAMIPANGWSNTVYVGMATTANTNKFYTQAQYSGYGNYTTPTNRQVLFLVGSGRNTPAGAANAPVTQNSGNAGNDALIYTNLIKMGFNVLTIVNETLGNDAATKAAAPDIIAGKSVIVWSSSGNSGGTGTPSVFTNMPVPVLTWENGAPRYLNMVTSGENATVTGQTAIVITNTAGPVASALSMGNSGINIVCASASMARVTKTALASGATIVAEPGTSSAYAVFYAYDKGAVMASGINSAPHRRVGLFLDDSTPLLLNSLGLQLITNAIQWASIKNDEAPTVWTQPASQAVPTGSPVTFLVTAIGGSGPYTYQWSQIASGATNVITGGTNRDYVILAAVLGDSGSGYFVKVTGINSGLSITSSVATLTVQTPITITSQPQSVTNATGTTATFSVTATGTSPAYQWYSNNVAIAGATSNPYTTPTLTISYSNSVYKVVVTNLISSVTSSNAVLTVISGGTAGFSSITSASGQVTLTWTNGTALLTSTNLLLPMASWTVVPGATSPYTVPETNAQRFFRVQQ